MLGDRGKNWLDLFGSAADVVNIIIVALQQPTLATGCLAGVNYSDSGTLRRCIRLAHSDTSVFWALLTFLHAVLFLLDNQSWSGVRAI